MNMSIRAGLAAAAIAAASVVGLGPTSADELKLAHFMSPKHPYHEGVFEWLGVELSKATNSDSCGIGTRVRSLRERKLGR